MTIRSKFILYKDILKTKGFSKFLNELKDIKAYTKYYKIKPNDVVIDIGAYHGWFTLLNYNYNSRFYAFDIDPVNYKILNKNLFNKFRNISFFNKGVWNQTGVSKLYGDRVGSMGSHINFKNKRKSKDVECQVVTLEDIVKENNIKKIDFIKIDVEGSEIEIIESSLDLLKKYKPNLSIATYHVRDNQKTYLKIEELLKKVGYAKVFTENKKHLTTYAIK